MTFTISYNQYKIAPMAIIHRAITKYLNVHQYENRELVNDNCESAKIKYYDYKELQSVQRSATF